MSKQHSCWSCSEIFKTAGVLRNHFMCKPHQFLSVVCPWCSTRKIFRRPVDLRSHITKEHPKIKREHGAEFPTDREAFYLSLATRAYLNSTNVVAEDGPLASVLREAVLANPSLGPMEKWQEGWERHCHRAERPAEPRPYSPTRPAMWDAVSVTMLEREGLVVVNGGGGETLRLTIPPIDNRAKERLHRLKSLTSTLGEVPQKWETTDKYQFNTDTILRDLGIAELRVAKVERNSSWEERREPEKKRQLRERTPLSPLRSPSFQLEVGIEEEIDSPPPAVETKDDKDGPQKPDATGNHEEPEGGDLTKTAKLLLTFGVMPLFPPARRDWGSGITISLPLSDGISQWPPHDWLQMDPDTRLLQWEAVATALSLKWGMPSDRVSVQDAFQFLAFPGSRHMEGRGPEKDARRANFMVVRSVYLKKPVVEGSSLLNMFYQAYVLSPSSQPGGYQDLLVQASQVPLRI